MHQIPAKLCCDKPFPAGGFEIRHGEAQYIRSVFPGKFTSVGFLSCSPECIGYTAHWEDLRVCFQQPRCCKEEKKTSKVFIAVISHHHYGELCLLVWLRFRDKELNTTDVKRNNLNSVLDLQFSSEHSYWENNCQKITIYLISVTLWINFVNLLVVFGNVRVTFGHLRKHSG